MFNQILAVYKEQNIINNELSIADNNSVTLVINDGTIVKAEVNKMNNKGVKITTTYVNGIVKTKLVLNDDKSLIIKLAVIIHELDIAPVKKDDVIKVITNKTYTVIISNKTDCEGYFTIITKLNRANVSTSQHMKNELKDELLNIKSMAALLKFVKINRTWDGMLPNYQEQFNK